MKIHSFEMDYKEVWVLEQNTEQRERRHQGYVKSARIKNLFGLPPFPVMPPGKLC